MLLELGNAHPKNVNHGDAAVTYVSVAHTNNDDHSVDVIALRTHLFERALAAGNDAYAVHSFPGSETLTELFNPVGGFWAEHSFDVSPSWAWCEEDPQLAAVVAAYTNCTLGRPGNVEDTHHTIPGGPPGVNMSAGPTALIVNSGNDILSKQIGGGGIYTAAGTSTAVAATSLTNTGAAFSTSLVGQVVYTGAVYGVIESATATVLTIDRWYNVATPGGVAGTTPGTGTYLVGSGTAAAMFMGISSTNAASVATDTTMAGEITTAGGGLIRALATYAHTASATTYTLANTFTSNGSDALPVTIYRDGLFISIVSGWANSMLAETLLNASAVLSLVGDAVTVTHTLTV